MREPPAKRACAAHWVGWERSSVLQCVRFSQKPSRAERVVSRGSVQKKLEFHPDSTANEKSIECMYHSGVSLHFASKMLVLSYKPWNIVSEGS